jgi:hypothetical protein
MDVYAILVSCGFSPESAATVAMMDRCGMRPMIPFFLANLGE